MIAIARAVDMSAKVLILDEPTSSLDDGEVEKLFNLMRRLKSEVSASYSLPISWSRCMQSAIRSPFLGMGSW